MSNKIYLFIVFLLFTFSLKAQNTLILKVQNEANEPIVGATAQLFGLFNYNAITNENGEIKLNVKKGFYTIHTAYIGYITDTTEVQISAGLATSITLKTKDEILQGVVVKANKNFSFINPNLKNITLNAKAISLVPKLFGQTDPIRAIQFLPGISFSHEASSELNIRGGAKDQTMYSINGTPIYSQEHLLGLYSSFNNEAITKIELFTENIPSRLGSFGSSILEIEYQIDQIDSNQTYVDLGVMALGVGSKFGSKNKRLFSNTNFRSSYIAFASELPADFWDFSSSISYIFKNNSRLSFLAHFGNDNLALNELYAFQIAFNKQTSFAQLNFTQPSTKFGEVRHTFGYSKIDRLGTSNVIVNSEFDESSRLNGQNWFNYNLQFVEKKINLIRVNFGLQSYLGVTFKTDHYYSDLVNYSLPFQRSFENKEILQRVFTLVPYFEAKIDTNDFDLSIAIRSNSIYNVSDETFYNPLEGSAGIGYSVKRYRISFDFDRRVQINHTLTPLFISNNYERLWLSDANFKPQLANQLTLTQKLTSRKYLFKTGIYAKTYSNIYQYKDGIDLQNLDLSEDLGNGNGVAYGAEVNFNYTSPAQALWLNYTYSRSFIRSIEINNNDYYPADFDRPHVAKLMYSLKVRKHARFSLTGLLASGRPFTGVEYDNGPFILYSTRNAFRLPFYKRVDVGISNQRSLFNGKIKLEVNYGAYNVLNFRNPFFVVHSGISVNQDGNLISKYDFVNLLPIVPYFSLKVAF
jgi:hypothetical protein